MVIVNPTNNQLQKPIEVSKQYLKKYKQLFGDYKNIKCVLSKNFIDDDDELSDFE